MNRRRRRYNYESSRICALCKKKYQKGCGNLFRLPKNPKDRIKWSEVCGVNFSPSALICSQHFLPSNIVNVANKAFLMPDAEPIAGIYQNVNETPSLDEQYATDTSTETDSLLWDQKSEFLIKEEPRERFFIDQETQTDRRLYDDQGTQTEIHSLKHELITPDIKTEL